MAKGVAFDLLKVAERIGPQSEAAEDEDLSREKNLTWTASSSVIKGAIGLKGDDTEELSMKAPMSVSKLADLGRGSRTMRLGRMVTGGKEHFVLPRFGPSRWR